MVSLPENSPQGAWDNIAEANVAGICRKWASYLSVQRLHCPGVILKSKGRGKLSIHFAADQDTIDTIYRIILSVNQLSVSTEQWQPYARNLRAIKIDQGNLRF